MTITALAAGARGKKRFSKKMREEKKAQVKRAESHCVGVACINDAFFQKSGGKRDLQTKKIFDLRGKNHKCDPVVIPTMTGWGINLRSKPNGKTDKHHETGCDEVARANRWFQNFKTME